MWTVQEKNTDLEYAKYFQSLGLNTVQIEVCMSYIESGRGISVALRECRVANDKSEYKTDNRCSE